VCAQQVIMLNALQPANPAFEWLRGYESPFLAETGDGALLAQGEEEHYWIGQRLRAAYPLLSQAYDPTTWVLQTTAIPRSVLLCVL
jgi:hypothetical protein